LVDNVTSGICIDFCPVVVFFVASYRPRAGLGRPVRPCDRSDRRRHFRGNGARHKSGDRPGAFDQTDSAGRYELTALPVGQYDMSAVKDGFSERIRSGISLVIGRDATVDLSLAVGDVKEQVKVTGDAALVTATTQDISGLVGEKGSRGTPPERA
jgi:hypothetical protein